MVLSLSHGKVIREAIRSEYSSCSGIGFETPLTRLFLIPALARWKYLASHSFRRDE
jgi:hypothetical protein